MIVALLIALPIVVGPMLLPRGVVVAAVAPFLTGSLTTYRRVTGFEALAAWWRDELEAEPGDR